MNRHLGITLLLVAAVLFGWTFMWAVFVGNFLLGNTQEFPSFIPW